MMPSSDTFAKKSKFAPNAISKNFWCSNNSVRWWTCSHEDAMPYNSVRWWICSHEEEKEFRDDAFHFLKIMIQNKIYFFPHSTQQIMNCLQSQLEHQKSWKQQASDIFLSNILAIMKSAQQKRWNKSFFSWTIYPCREHRRSRFMKKGSTSELRTLSNCDSTTIGFIWKRKQIWRLFQ